MHIISIAIQKGGSGKTTTAINLAAALRDRDKEVLLIDMDPQANLTQSLGMPDEPEENIYQVLRDEAFGETPDLASIIVPVHGMDLAPAALELAGAEMELVGIYGREHILSQLLGRLEKKYDFILIDCPPSFGMLTVNALVASDWYLMPRVNFCPPRRDKFYEPRGPAQQDQQKLDLLGFRHDPIRSAKNHEPAGYGRTIEKYGADKMFRMPIRPTSPSPPRRRKAWTSSLSTKTPTA
ncbi:MAG: ParA family protein, partial [Lewinellaceae bacterium]|nr:ParA family protein [Lewinellaceae bacterium]